MDLCSAPDSVPAPDGGRSLGDAALCLDLSTWDSRAQRDLGTAAGQANRYLHGPTDLAAMSTEPGSGGSKVNAVANILSSGNTDTWVKLGTLALVALSGGGNFFATKQAERVTADDAEKAVKEIHEVYVQLDASIARQKAMEETLRRIDERTKPEH